MAEPVTLALEGDRQLGRPDALVRAAGMVIDETERSRAGIVLRLAAHKPLR